MKSTDQGEISSNSHWFNFLDALTRRVISEYPVHLYLAQKKNA